MYYLEVKQLFWDNMDESHQPKKKLQRTKIEGTWIPGDIKLLSVLDYTPLDCLYEKNKLCLLKDHRVQLYSMTVLIIGLFLANKYISIWCIISCTPIWHVTFIPYFLYIIECISGNPSFIDLNINKFSLIAFIEYGTVLYALH